MLTGKNRCVAATEKEDANAGKHKQQGSPSKQKVQLPCRANSQHPNRDRSSVQHFLTGKKRQQYKQDHSHRRPYDLPPYMGTLHLGELGDPYDNGALH